MATCLCAPTTHEGSFRCRLHRGNPMILEGSTHSCSSNLETKPRPTCEGLQEDGGQSMSVLRPSPSLPRQISNPKSAIDRYGNRHLCRPSQSSSPPPSSSAYLPSKTSNTSSQSPSTTSSPQFRPRRPPLSPKARCALPSIPTSGSSSIGSETTHSKVIAAAVYESPSRISAEKRGSTRSIAGRAAAMAILKRHMNNKGNKNNNGIMPRSVERRKIGLSRFSKMERQRKDQELPLRKEETPSNMVLSENLSSMGRSFEIESAKLQTTEPKSVDVKNQKLQIPELILKIKKNEVTCKVVGYKIGQNMVPIVF